MQAGDRQAFDRFFEKHAGKVLVYIQYRLGGRLRRKVDPTDILQNIYFGVFRKFQSFRRRAERLGVQKVLIRMADHEITEAYRYHFKAHKRDARRELTAGCLRGAEEGGFEDLDWIPSDATSITARVARHEEYLRAVELLRRLDPIERFVTVSRVIEDLSMAEIAKRLGKSPGAVRMILSRARSKLRKKAPAQGD